MLDALHRVVAPIGLVVIARLARTSADPSMPTPAAVAKRPCRHSVAIGDLAVLASPRFFALTGADGSVFTLYRADSDGVCFMNPLTGEFRRGSPNLIDEFDRFHRDGRMKGIDASRAATMRLEVVDAYRTRYEVMLDS